MDAFEYFQMNHLVKKRQYDALKEFFFLKRPAKEVAQKYGYTETSFYSLTRDFRNYLRQDKQEDFFFISKPKGRKKRAIRELDDIIITHRKHNFSVEEIVAITNAMGFDVTYGYVYSLLRKEGFARLHRRSKRERKEIEPVKIKAPETDTLEFKAEKFYSTSTGLLSFLPIIKKYGLDKVIAHSSYPETSVVNRMSSILAFVALKASNIKRYSKDDLWCMDRGMGLFAGLNVLPKAAWFSSYSSRVTSDMNMKFLRALHSIWTENDLLSDTSNLDFTTIPYWGNDDHLENNWSGKRHKALPSMLAVLAQDPDSGIIDYGHCNVMHNNEPKVVLEYLDFYKRDGAGELRYLVFDSKFTSYENLSKLDDNDVNFITIRRRGKNLVESVKNKSFKKIRIEASGLKKRSLNVVDERITLKGYIDFKTGKKKEIRQIIITGNGKIKPGFVILNDFEISVEQVVRKYARRWLVEKGISQQIEFFHLNRVTSSMVIKVDFDFVMTILTHNLYRLFALELERYSHFTAERIYEKFIENKGDVEIKENEIIVGMKKKRDLPLILETMKLYDDYTYPWLNQLPIYFQASSSS